MNNNLHVVYFFEPWTELGRPYLRYHNLRYQMGTQIYSLAKLGCKVTVLMGETTYEKTLDENYTIDNVEFKVIREDELKSIFPNYVDATNSLHKGTQTDEQSKAYKDLIESKISETPDVFISFLSPVDFLKPFWEETLILYTEFGMPPPYPRTFYFDNQGIFENSYVRSLQGAEFKHSREDWDKFQDLKDKINLTASEDLFKKQISQFDKNVLLPLQFSNYFGFDATCNYKSQYDFLIDTLEKTPEDIGVIVTEHTGWEPTITEHNIEHLKKRYKNLITSEALLATTNSSQALIRQVDAVVSVSSSVALQGVFWEKPIFAMGDSHLNAFNAGDLMDAEIIKNHDATKNNSVILHLINNYYIDEKYAYNAVWFKEKLLSMIESKRANRNAYDTPVDTNYIQHLTKSIRNIEYEVSTVKKNKVLKKIQNEPKLFIGDFDVISFDIFDTLVQRPFNMPHQMFLFMEETARKIVGDDYFEFHKIRRLSEHLVRTETNLSEISIEDIYGRIQADYRLTDEQTKNLIKLEIDTELHFCEERQTGKKIFNLAKQENKKIFLVSDFHIHNEDVKRILHNCGYDGWDELIVSCDYGKSKKDGSLFEHILMEKNLDPKTIVHIGDSENSDVINAQSFNIKTIHTPKGTDIFFKNGFTRNLWEQEQNRVLYPTEDLARGSAAMLGLCINKLHSDIEQSDQNSAFHGDAEKLGYCLFGPLFTAFSVNLARHGKDKNYAFLSRDGSIFLKVFRELYPEYEHNYLLTSRRALSVATFTSKENIMKALQSPFSPGPLRGLLTNKFGLPEEKRPSCF